MIALRHWWAERSPREQWLLSIMLGLLLAVIGWYGVWQPLQAARQAADARLESASLTRQTAARQLAMLKRGPAATLATPTAQLVTQSANDAGFQPGTTEAQGEDRITITIPAVRARALFAWLIVLERQGVFVDQIQITTRSDASLSASLTLRRAMR
jgi:general secretion pathway protein M